MPTWRFKLLYDGECPFCRREVEWLKRWDQTGLLATEDIAALGFDPSRYGLTRDEVMRVLHGVKPDGMVLSRMEAVREAYRTVGLGWLLAPTRLPVLRAVSDSLYGLFARNRETWGEWLGRGCSKGSCDPRARSRSASSAGPSD
jgi:predicted DCC family thiol-disulfide oxidoreductase YuxK